MLEMKWIAKRILLKSYENMDVALLEFVISFVDQIKQENGIVDWYCSRKTENNLSKPSIRIYLKIEESQELDILSKLDSLVQGKKDTIGWTGKYNIPDPTPPELSKSNLKAIQKGCEIALRLMQTYSEMDRHKNQKFLNDLKTEFYVFLNSMENNFDCEAIHFIANNLGLRDEYFKALLSEYIKTR